MTETVMVGREKWLRGHGWVWREGAWWYPHSTLPPMQTDQAFKMGQILAECDA